MTKQTKNETATRESKNVGERDYFIVKVFPDEYESVGVEDEMSLFEAQVHVRTLLGVPLPMRRGQSASMSALSSAIRDTSVEKRQQIMAILADEESDSDSKANEESNDETDEFEE